MIASDPPHISNRGYDITSACGMQPAESEARDGKGESAERKKRCDLRDVFASEADRIQRPRVCRALRTDLSAPLALAADCTSSK